MVTIISHDPKNENGEETRLALIRVHTSANAADVAKLLPLNKFRVTAANDMSHIIDSYLPQLTISLSLPNHMVINRITPKI